MTYSPQFLVESILPSLAGCEGAGVNTTVNFQGQGGPGITVSPYLLMNFLGYISGIITSPDQLIGPKSTPDQCKKLYRDLSQTFSEDRCQNPTQKPFVSKIQQTLNGANDIIKGTTQVSGRPMKDYFDGKVCGLSLIAHYVEPFPKGTKLVYKINDSCWPRSQQPKAQSVASAKSEEQPTVQYPKMADAQKVQLFVHELTEMQKAGMLQGDTLKAILENGRKDPNIAAAWTLFQAQQSNGSVPAATASPAPQGLQQQTSTASKDATNPVWLNTWRYLMVHAPELAEQWQASASQKAAEMRKPDILQSFEIAKSEHAAGILKDFYLANKVSVEQREAILTLATKEINAAVETQGLAKHAASLATPMPTPQQYRAMNPTASAALVTTLVGGRR